MATDRDPHGLDPHAPGAKLDAGKPMVGLMLRGFPRALRAVAQVTTYGAQKYSPNGWQFVPDGEARYTDAMGRHLLLETEEGPYDGESGQLHAAMVAWNALARLELLIRGGDECQPSPKQPS
jgi:hypothetical protein